MVNVADRLTVDQAILVDGCNSLADGFGDRDNKTPAVYADDFVSDLTDHEPSAVKFLLETVNIVGEQA